MALHFKQDALATGAPGDAARRRRVALAVGGVAAALAVAYGVGAHHFSTHFTPNTTVGGVDAAWLTTDELAQAVEARVAAYQDHVTGDGLDFTVSAPDVALAVDGQAIAQEALAQTDPLAWPLSLVTRRALAPTVGVTYSDELLSGLVSAEVAAFDEQADPPTDATCAWDDEQAAFVVVPSALGTKVSADAVTERVAASLATLSPTTLLGEAELTRPDVADDDEALVTAVEQANTIASLSVPLTLDGKTLVTVGPELIHDWLTVSCTDDGGQVSVDGEAIYHWSYDNLNAVVNGENETRVWEVHSREVANQLRPRLEAADGSAMEIPTITISTRPAESAGHEARGRHIDVNLATQYARLYADDGKTVLWRSPLVSGNLAWDHATPEGEFQITNMQEGVTLTGLNDGVELKEGEDPKPEDYYNSYVNYWMAFIGDSVGLHDATWRYEEEFGGETYLWNGSHGCVNLPYDEAKQLYGLIHVGDKVVVHE